MSRYSNDNAAKPEEVAELNLEWKAAPKEGDAGFYYYDKEAEAMVPMSKPIRFVALDDSWAAVRGFSKKHNGGIYSSEWQTFRSKTDEIFVGCFADGQDRPVEIAKGPYSSIKGEIADAGGKYHQVLYALMHLDGEWKVVRFYLKGSVSQAWDEFTKNNPGVLKPGSGVLWDGSTNTEKGAMMDWEVPIFTRTDLKEETEVKAEKADERLQEFFKLRADFYQSKRAGAPADKQAAQEQPAQEEDTQTVTADTEDEIPF